MRILACADLHISDRRALAGMHPIDRETGRPLVLEQGRRMLDWIAEELVYGGNEDCPAGAGPANVDLVIVAGDVFDSPNPSNASRRVVAEWLANLVQWVPVVVVPGNHDGAGREGDDALAPLDCLAPDRLHVLRRPGRVTVAEVDIYPLPYPSRAYLGDGTASPEETAAAVSGALDAVLLAYACEARQLRGRRPQILVGHGTLRGARYAPHQSVPATDVQVSTELMDAFHMALWGHIHQRQPAPGLPGWCAETHGYVGAGDRHDFGEAAEVPGVTIFELSPFRAPELGGPWKCSTRHYPHARQFVTLAPREVAALEPEMRAQVADGDQRWVYRVVGEYDAESRADVGALVRKLRGAGVVIADQTTTQAEDRARVMVDSARGREGLSEAVFAARPDLRQHAEAITARLAEMEV